MLGKNPGIVFIVCIVLLGWLDIKGPCRAALIQDAPRVVKAVPDNLDADVDPQSTKIRIEFDQEMSANGYSVCGGGPSFPQLVGKPAWVDSKTLEFEVRLQPEHEYVLSINCESAQQCRNRQNVPAVPYPISFRTRAADQPASSPLTVNQQQEMLQSLKQLIDQNYSYRDLRGVDWNRHWEKIAGNVTKPASAGAFARLVVNALQVANDPHITVKSGAFAVGTMAQPLPVANFNGRTLGGMVQNLVNHNRCVATANIGNDIGYVLITSWSDGEDMLRPALDFLANSRAWRGLIIDVRLNRGGDEKLARKIAGHFVDSAKVYAQHRFRDSKQSSGFGDWQQRVLEPVAQGQAYAGPVAVLMGPANMSSNEAFLLMMRQAGRARLFGERSLGSSGNPQPYELGQGISVLLPSWQSALPDGSLLEGVGVEPHESVKTTAQDLAKTDAVLSAALDWLRKQ